MKLYTPCGMEALIPIIAILMIFGAPTYLAKRAMDLKQKRLEQEGAGNKQLPSGAMKELEALREENKLLAARVEAMEETVFSGDFELNQKLKQLALDEAKGSALSTKETKELQSGKPSS